MCYQVACRSGMLLCLIAVFCAGSLALADAQLPTDAIESKATELKAAEFKATELKATEPLLTTSDVAPHSQSISRTTAIVSSLTVFLLAIFVGVEVITKVPPTLHTPLMSGSNAISGITIIGAILVAGHANGGFGSLLGLIAVVLAMINVVGGFLVTHRMLMMFKKR